MTTPIVEFTVPDMMCGGCARGVTKAVQKVDAAAQVDADPESKLVRVTTEMPREAFVATLAAAGFPVA